MGPGSKGHGISRSAEICSAEICRKIGVSQQTFYTLRTKYAGMGVSELRELRQLREENKKLNQLEADLSLDKHMLQEVLSRKR